MAKEIINPPLGGTGQTNTNDVLEALGLQNHDQLSINSGGEVTSNNTITNLNLLNSSTVGTLDIGTLLSTNFDKIRRIDHTLDTTTYSTTTTTQYAAAGEALQYTPHSSSDTSLLVLSNVYTQAGTNTSDRAGFRGRLEYYDGSTWNNSVALSQGIYIHYNIPDISYARRVVSCALVLSQNERRTDNGNWTPRWYYDSIYGGTTYIYQTDFLTIEYEV